MASGNKVRIHMYKGLAISALRIEMLGTIKSAKVQADLQLAKRKQN